MDNAVDKKFREGLSRQRVNPSPELWDRLEAQLEKKKGGLFLGWRYYAVAAVILLLLGIPAMIFMQPKGQQEYELRQPLAHLEGEEEMETEANWQFENQMSAAKESLALVSSKKLDMPQSTVKNTSIGEVPEERQLPTNIPQKRVIKASVRPINLLPQQVAIAAPQEFPIAESEKEKWTVKRVFDQLMAIKRGEVKVPKNIYLNVPKPDLFASK